MKTPPNPDYSCIIISEPPATQLQSKIVTLHFETITVHNFAISPDGSETPGDIKFTLPPKLTKTKPCNCHPYQNHQTP